MLYSSWGTSQLKKLGLQELYAEMVALKTARLAKVQRLKISEGPADARIARAEWHRRCRHEYLVLFGLPG
jgi:hypothetical protein